MTADGDSDAADDAADAADRDTTEDGDATEATDSDATEATDSDATEASNVTETTEDADDAPADPRVVSETDCDWTTTERGDTAFRRKRLGRAAGSRELGCSLYEVPPGKKSWPYHFHAGNEEAVYVLSGEGAVRTPDGETAVSPGSYVALPAGENGAHRIVNAGDEPLRYLAVSTMNDPDVTAYPDSGKLGVFAGAPPGGPSDERVLSGYFRADDAVSYWEGEE